MEPIPMTSIRQLSQEVGIGVDTLRVWERRYGFPKPKRNAQGHRLYPARQVEELRIIRRLQSHGYRPGRLLAMTAVERRQLLDRELARENPLHDSLRQLVREMSPQEIDRELRSNFKKLAPRDF